MRVTMWGLTLKAVSPESQSSKAKSHRRVQLRAQIQEVPESINPRVRVFKSESPISSPQSPLSRIVTYVCL